MPTAKRSRAAIAAWSIALIGTVLLILSSVMQETAAAAAIDWASWLIVRGAALAAGQVSPHTEQIIQTLTPALLSAAAYAALALVLWLAVSHSGPGRHASAALTAAGCTLVAVVAELLQIFTPGRLPQVSDCLLSAGAGIAVAACIWLYQWAERKLPRLVNRETVSYVFFGAVTTVVNILSYQVFYHTLGIPNLISNALAWVLSVLVAYIVNKLFVFRSSTTSIRALLREFGLFVAARLFSFGVDELGMWLMVDVARFNTGISKLIVNVIVVVLNYFFSKRIIFTRKDGSATDQTTNA
ncbi:MAG: VanZ family protein [Acutalibacteraceae bacterium]